MPFCSELISYLKTGLSAKKAGHRDCLVSDSCQFENSILRFFRPVSNDPGDLFNARSGQYYTMSKTAAIAFKKVKKYFEDFELNEGRATGRRTITGEDIDLHAEESGDYFPHHMDAEWCKTQPFKKRMAHGTLVLTIAIGLTADVINEVCMTYGYDRIRFIKPVFIDDTIHVVTKIREKKDHKKPGFGLIIEQVETFNQNNELVMACEHIYLAEKRGPEV